MKTKLTRTIDEDLVPKAKRYARVRGVSLSSVVEGALRGLAMIRGVCPPVLLVIPRARRYFAGITENLSMPAAFRPRHQSDAHPLDAHR